MTLVSTHRGYDIYKQDNTHLVMKNGYQIAKCNTAWSCVAYIDELKSC